jgi:exodeoxyribonuclease VII large subunit
MGKQVTSQWDFGELFPVEATRRVLTVSELTTRVKRLLENEIGAVWVTGEVTNLRIQSSGHIYFTLRDASGQLNCVLFRSDAGENGSLLEDGRKIIVQGDLTVYEPRGQYQLVVRQVEHHGLGALQIAFEKLKQKLQAEGLFAPERKRPLPRYPQRIGLVTSPTGAAIRDVLHVIQRRNPALEIIFVPCCVQGAGAGTELAAAIRLLNEFACSVEAPGRVSIEPAAIAPPQPFNRTTRLDLILLTRGGGSLEDLWAFNEEIVARAIFESRLPVVSAVGHEIDFTISDFVADVRAATPSAAAEIITEDVFASRRFVMQTPLRLRALVAEHIESEKEAVQQLVQRILRVHPHRQVNERLQYLDDLQASLVRCARSGFRHERQRWQGLSQRLLLVKPSQVLSRRKQVLQALERRLAVQGRPRVADLRGQLSNVEARLRLLSPLNVLERGYSITSDAQTGKVIRETNEVKAGQRLRTRLKSGEISSVVEAQD